MRIPNAQARERCGMKNGWMKMFSNDFAELKEWKIVGLLYEGECIGSS